MREALYTPFRKPGSAGPAARTAAHPFSAKAAAFDAAPSFKLWSARSKYFDPALRTGTVANAATAPAVRTKADGTHDLKQHPTSNSRAKTRPLCVNLS